MNYHFDTKANLQRKFPIYIASLLLVSVSFVFLVNRKSCLKRDQKFNLFISLNDVDSDQLKQEVASYVDSNQIRQIIVNPIGPLLESYFTLYGTYGVNDADLLILREDLIVKPEMVKFVSLNEGNEYYLDSNFVYEDTHYGIEVFDGNQGYLTDCLNYEKENKYYLFINKKSKHLKGFVDSSETDYVKRVLEGLLHEKE